MPRVFSSDQCIADFVVSRTGLRLAPGQYTQLGIVQDGVVTGGVVFTHYSGNDISVTVAASSPKAFTKTFLTRCGHYLFSELRVSRITILTEQPAVVKIAQRLGATVEGVKRDQFGIGRNAIMLGLLAKDWPFGETKRLRPSSSECHMTNGIRSRRSRT